MSLKEYHPSLEQTSQEIYQLVYWVTKLHH